MRHLVDFFNGLLGLSERRPDDQLIPGGAVISGKSCRELTCRFTSLMSLAHTE